MANTGSGDVPYMGHSTSFFHSNFRFQSSNFFPILSQTALESYFFFLVFETFFENMIFWKFEGLEIFPFSSARYSEPISPIENWIDT